MKTIALHPEDVTVWGNRKRDIDPAAVDRIAASMADIGLRQPITVRVLDELEIDGEILCGAPVLVTGAHRLAAAKKLGWQAIDCIEIEGDEIDAELWEISENLHRLDLSKEQRDEHVRRYAALLEQRRKAQEAIVEQNPQQLPQRPVGRPKSITTEVAEATGLSRDIVKRALHPPAPKAVQPAKSREEQILSEANAIINAWNRASAEAREMALEQMDGPVMDNCRAGAD